MDKALVTGGAGFIGSHLSRRLVSQGYRVYCVDNLSTGSERNIEDLKAKKNFKFIKHDITKDLPVNLRRELRGLRKLYHLASPASPKDYYEMPLETLLTNSAGTYKMLELAREEDARFLLASTSEVYGDPEEHPQKETYWGNVNPVGPRSPYDESKRFAESMTMTYIRKFGLDARIARIFNTYGPNMRKDDGRPMPNFINQLLREQPMTIYGDGKQTRSWCYVSDQVEGELLLMEKEGISGEVVNLGNPEEIEIIELAKIIARMFGKKPEFKFLPPLENDPVRRKPDIEKAKKLLGWEPKVGLEEGLKDTIEYFKEER